MVSSRRLSLISVTAAAAFLAAGFISADPIRPVCLALGCVLIGLALGALISKTNRSRANSRPHGFSSELLDSTINEMREGLVVIDADMRIVALNQAAQRLFAHVESSIERRITEITRNPAIYDAFLDGVRGTERVGVKVETHDPERRIFDLRVVPLRASANSRITGAIGVFFDVTRLERLENVRQEFLSNVSHELRTPLTSIIALSETLAAGAIDDPENNRRFLSIIQKNSTRMHRLIDDILELSAIEAGNVTLYCETVPLRNLVEDVINSLLATAAARNIKLKNVVASPANVYADPHRLMQMLTNLIDNAIKFNREGGEVVISLTKGDRDQILVSDTGEGIPSHHLDRLFERFYRVDRARSRELGGTGLGLAIVKHLAKSHGGEVTVRSQMGQGTEFTIELPRLMRSTTLNAIAAGGP